MVLQVMSEEKSSGFLTEPTANGSKRIVSIGRDPWRVRRFAGSVQFKRPDAGSLRVTPLDPNGDPFRRDPSKKAGPRTGASEITLEPTTLYYLIEAA
jgi:hypothetical protein